MTDSNAGMAHLDPTRADAARRAQDELLQAAATWADAPKTRVGAVVLPGSRSAAVAFDAFFGARRELAHHLGGAAAAVAAEEALAAEDATTDSRPPDEDRLQ